MSIGLLGFIFFVLICPTAVFSEKQLITQVCKQTLNSTRCEEVLSKNTRCLEATNLFDLADALLAVTTQTTKAYMNVMVEMIHRKPSSCIRGQLIECMKEYNSVYSNERLMHTAVRKKGANGMKFVWFTSKWNMDVLNSCDLKIKEETQPTGMFSCLYRGRRRKDIRTVSEMNGVLLTHHEIVYTIAVNQEQSTNEDFVNRERLPGKPSKKVRFKSEPEIINDAKV